MIHTFLVNKKTDAIFRLYELNDTHHSIRCMETQSTRKLAKDKLNHYNLFDSYMEARASVHLKYNVVLSESWDSDPDYDLMIKVILGVKYYEDFPSSSYLTEHVEMIIVQINGELRSWVTNQLHTDSVLELLPKPYVDEFLLIPSFAQGEGPALEISNHIVQIEYGPHFE